MRILHTSDWHLGRRLCGQERYGEFKSFLDWLTGVVSREAVDALVIAGDVFDSCTPPLWAQSLYYSFLTGLFASPCKSVTVVAGNHDSAALLDAPAELLSRLNVFVVGEPQTPEREVLQLPDGNGETGALCCAVPFLRSRDLCGAMTGQDAEAVAAAELEGFQKHYAAVVAEAEKLRAGRDIPLIATGHCFVVGGRCGDDDGVRDLSVGSIDAVPLSAFPESIDYLALGHLHGPQRCGGMESRRYSGSPLCMGFGETGQQKSLSIVDFQGRSASVRTLPVPRFQSILRLTGSYDDLLRRISRLVDENEPVWVEADCTDRGNRGLNESIRELAPERSPVKILRIKVPGMSAAESLGSSGGLAEDWSPAEVFKLFLKEHDLRGEGADALMGVYMEALEAVRQEERE
ncbi:MAG: exonuclease subunit SbcD [Pyramidobacter sp.]